MGHVVLLGDSIFDNKAWVYDGSDVITNLRSIVSEEWKVSLRAIDGSTIQYINTQIKDLPTDTSLLIISVGGNDALRYSPILTKKAESVEEVMKKMTDIREQFQKEYQSMLQEVLKLGIMTVVSTIYYPRFSDVNFQRVIITMLSIFNNCIVEEAIRNKLSMLDLRFVCDEETDYTNAIEPSSKGGKKIALAIAKIIKQTTFNPERTEVFSK